jgi:hypothetical protein
LVSKKPRPKAKVNLYLREPNYIMSYENLLAGLYTNNIVSKPAEQPKNALQEIQTPLEVQPAAPSTPLQLFTVETFKNNLKEKTAAKNKQYAEYSTNINAYDVFSCIRIPFFRINSYPVPDYSSNYLPVELRCALGNACHEFIQAVPNTFTETELCLKVPNLKISVRLDAVINDNVLVEIKSCAYSDYDKILKSNSPRNKDFYQSVVYKYLIENYLDIIKKQKPSRNGSIPKLDKYNITHIQFIYVCHELIAAEAETFEESVKLAKDLKRQLNSQRNPFWFLKALTIDLTKINIDPYVSYISDKIATIYQFLDRDEIPPLDHKYIDKKDCYFCMYNKICGNYK